MKLNRGELSEGDVQGEIDRQEQGLAYLTI